MEFTLIPIRMCLANMYPTAFRHTLLIFPEHSQRNPQLTMCIRRLRSARAYWRTEWSTSAFIIGQRLHLLSGDTILRCIIVGLNWARLYIYIYLYVYIYIHLARKMVHIYSNRDNRGDTARSTCYNCPRKISSPSLRKGTQNVIRRSTNIACLVAKLRGIDEWWITRGKWM